MHEIDQRMREGEELQLKDRTHTYTMFFFNGGFYLRVDDNLPITFDTLDALFATVIDCIGRWRRRSL